MLRDIHRKFVGAGIAFTAAGFVFLGFLGVSSTAQAVPLAPGATVIPDAVPLPSGTLIDDMTVPFTGTDFASNVVFTGNIESQVYQNGPGGTLDFVYKVTSNAGVGFEAINTLAVSTFVGFSTDASYVAGSGVVPTDAARDLDSSPGAAVYFDFFDPGDGGNGSIAPGDVTDYLVVKTNSTFFTVGDAAVIDGGTGEAVADIPFGSPVVPEPVSAALVSVSGGLLVLGRRRKI